MSHRNPQQSPPAPNAFPVGYVPFTASDGHEYLVPRYLVDITKTQVETENARAQRHPTKLPSQTLPKPFVSLAEGTVLSPADPPITDAESQDLHQEILNMQHRFGLTYKDAAHRLYLAEVAAMQADFDSMNAFAGIKDRIRHTVTNNIANPMIKIDQTKATLLDPQPDATLSLECDGMNN